MRGILRWAFAVGGFAIGFGVALTTANYLGASSQVAGFAAIIAGIFVGRFAARRVGGGSGKDLNTEAASPCPLSDTIVAPVTGLSIGSHPTNALPTHLVEVPPVDGHHSSSGNQPPSVVGSISQEAHFPAAHSMGSNRRLYVTTSDRFNSGQPEFSLMLSIEQGATLEQAFNIVKNGIPTFATLRMKKRDGRLSWTWLTYAGWLRYDRSKIYFKNIDFERISDTKFVLRVRLSKESAKTKFGGAAIITLAAAIIFPGLAILGLIFFVLWLASSLRTPPMTSARTIASDMAFRLQG